MSPKTHLFNSVALVGPHTVVHLAAAACAGILDGLCFPVILWMAEKIHHLAPHEFLAVLGAVFIVGWAAALLTFQAILRRQTNAHVGDAKGKADHHHDDEPPATGGVPVTSEAMALLIYAPASVIAQTAAAAAGMVSTAKRLPAPVSGPPD